MDATSNHEPGALVLVADDHDDAAPFLAALIEQSTTFQTAWAKDGQAALELALKARPEAAILDIEMPHLGSIQVARALRAAFPDRAPLLIAATGGELDEAIEAGVFDVVLRKPLLMEVLFDLLRKLTRPSRLSSASGW